MNNSIIYTPYLYHIGWSKTNMHYIGVEYKPTAHPDNLWTKYFTSSKYVNAYREENGEPDIVEVRKTFNTAEEAIQYEHKMLTKTDAARSELFLNKSNGGGKFANYGPLSDETKKKISESNKGRTFSAETKKKISDTLKGSTLSAETRQRLSEAKTGKKRMPHSAEAKKKISEANKGKIRSAETKKKMSKAQKGKTFSAESKKKMSESKKKMSAETKKKMSKAQKGKTFSAESKKKMSEAQKGKTQKVTVCPHCNKEGGARAMKRWHFDNCKHKEIIL